MLLQTALTARTTLLWLMPVMGDDEQPLDNFALSCDRVSAELQSTFLLLKPIHALWFTLESRSTGPNKESKRVIVLKEDETSEMDMFKYGGRKMLLDVISAYEASVNRIVSWVHEVDQSLHSRDPL